jgi:NAD-dependent SIR2 family protein deacetylase
MDCECGKPLVTFENETRGNASATCRNCKKELNSNTLEMRQTSCNFFAVECPACRGEIELSVADAEDGDSIMTECPECGAEMAVDILDLGDGLEADLAAFIRRPCQ